MACDDSATAHVARSDPDGNTDLSVRSDRMQGHTSSPPSDQNVHVGDVGNGMSKQRKALLHAWAPIVNRLRKASLPITFAFDESGGYWAFVVRRLDAAGLVITEENDNSITLRAITIPQHPVSHTRPEPKYGVAGGEPYSDAIDDSVSLTSRKST